MLSKKACKLCMDRFGPKTTFGVGWQQNGAKDEQRWKDNMVMRPWYFHKGHPEKQRMRDINKPPPDFCGYTLEHVVQNAK